MASDKVAQGDVAQGEAKQGADAVYTKGGDRGRTALSDGQRVSKAADRLEAYGSIDELNAVLACARQSVADTVKQVPALESLLSQLRGVQERLMCAASILATPPGVTVSKGLAIGALDVEALEQEMDRCSVALPPLSSFVYPGGCRLNAELHFARTVCRRAERRCVALDQHEAVDPQVLAYLNRLSDTLFVWSRWASQLLGADECKWMP